jgi:hypothetical protein
MTPHSKDVQPDSSSSVELLDASSLSTVLDMLAVIDSAEELSLLEALTPAQKRQVWDATPDSLKTQLKQIRSAHTGEKIAFKPALSEQSASEAPGNLEPTSPTNLAEEQDELGDAIAEAIAPAEQSGLSDPSDLSDSSDLSDPSDLLDPSDLSDPSDLAENLPGNLPDIIESVLQNPLPKVGDRVVLLSKSQLTVAEMTAIWQVVDVQAGHARIETKTLGSRRYPLTWMIIYPG